MDVSDNEGRPEGPLAKSIARLVAHSRKKRDQEIQIARTELGRLKPDPKLAWVHGVLAHQIALEQVAGADAAAAMASDVDDAFAAVMPDPEELRASRRKILDKVDLRGTEWDETGTGRRRGHRGEAWDINGI